jgi:hypothetical protein
MIFISCFLRDIQNSVVSPTANFTFAPLLAFRALPPSECVRLKICRRLKKETLAMAKVQLRAYKSFYESAMSAKLSSILWLFIEPVKDFINRVNPATTAGRPSGIAE